MVQWAGSPLTQAQAHVVVQHWNDILQHLAPPTVAWEWAESSLAPKTKHRLKQEDLVEPVTGGRWRATERLWLDVIDRASDAEDIGRGTSGQELLVDPVGNERESRVLTRQAPTLPLRDPIQQTLTGGDTDELDNDEEQRIGTNRAKANNESEDESEVAPGQLRLEVFDAGQTTIAAWANFLGSKDRMAA
jgi:hypothetical protein